MRIALLIIVSLLLLSACQVLPETTPPAMTTTSPAVTPTTAEVVLPLDEYLQQGIAFSGKAQFREAIDALSLYIKHGGNSAAAFFNRGVAYYHQQMFDPALADLSRAIELDNGYADAYFERSKTYAYKDKWDRTKADTTKVLQINPRLVTANYIRALAGIKEKEFDKAIKDLEVIGYMDPDDEKWSLLQDLTALAVPLNELVLLKLDLASKQTGTCAGGTCSAPMSYNITVRVIMFANPDKPGIFITGANLSPKISWLSEVQMRGSVYRPGMETLATNLAAAQAASGDISCCIMYKAGGDSKARESNSVKNQ